MPNRSLSYKLQVDTRSAIQDLKRFSREGKRAGEDIADGFDETETAGTNALRALTRQLDQLEQDSKDSARAAEAIGKQMAEGFDQARIAGFVADLRRVGVSYDEIEQKAEEFAAVVKRTDDTDLSGLNSELDATGAKLDKARQSGDQSRSVLANLAGNSSQSLGELGGVVGDLGVGLGQLVEYAVDGNIALKNLAAVAGPMAGLAAAGILVSKVVGDMAKVSESAESRTETFTQALIDGTDAWDAFREQVEETQALTFESDGLFGTGFGAKVQNVVGHLANLGLTLDDFRRIVENSTEEDKWRALLEQWKQTPSIGTVAVNSLLQMLEAVDDYQAGMGDAAAVAADVNAVLGETPVHLDKTTGAMEESLTAAAEMAQGLEDARQAIAEINAEELDVAGVLADELAKADTVLEGIAFDVNFDEAFGEALAGLDGFTPDLQTLADKWAAIIFGEDISILGSVAADDTAALAALKQVTDLFHEGVVREFKESGHAAATEFARAQAEAIAAETGLDISEVYRLMGLPPDGSIKTLIQPAIDADAADKATRILDVLAGVSTDPRIAEIQIQLIEGEITGEEALAATQAFMDDHPLTPSTDLDPVEKALTGLIRKTRNAKIGTTAPDAKTTETTIDDVARARTSTIGTNFVQQLVQNMILGAYLDYVARPRTVDIGVNVTGLATANQMIDYAARDRDTTITVDATTWGLQQAIATAISNAVRLGRIAS